MRIHQIHQICRRQKEKREKPAPLRVGLCEDTRYVKPTFFFLDGYCSTVQGLLDWFEVDLGFTELSCEDTRYVKLTCLFLGSAYWVVTVSRIDKMIGLFCRISSLLEGSFAKETYNFIDPTNQSHPILGGCDQWARALI